MIFNFGRYTIDVDIEKTRAFYTSDFSVATNEVCSCDCCQRFPDTIMACSPTVVSFLNSLGIDPRKPGEVFGSEEDSYNGWYHIVGTLLNGKISGACFDSSNSFVPDETVKFQVWFDDDNKRMGWIEENFPTPILEISFSAVLSK
ncbi:MAG: hypothetical protein IJY16_00825 [Clostridia bacterium]|nr:hypothetical protein [Clostridia bacterium]